MQENYNHSEIEKKQQRKWQDLACFNATENSIKPKFYCFSMLPYPSGKLHVGHVRNYTIGDVLARFYRMRGYNVLQPLGWDAFGLPAENAALQNNIPPATWTYQNIEYMRYQLQSIGLAIDWSREFATCSPEYYKHQQWLFIKLYEKGIIYRKNGIVNWDPVDQTVLANEQVIDGKGWRSGALIEKKEIPMYYFKITAYAEELLDNLDKLDGWPAQVKLMQKNWIGKSTGMEINFKVTELEDKVTVFTTRPETLMGVTYIAISAEHPLSEYALKQNPELKSFIDECKKGGVAEADIATQEKKGIFSGLFVNHPVTSEKLQIWLANYVLMNYGFGAVMGVPGHDQRDFEFATKYKLPIKTVVKPIDQDLSQPLIEPYTEKGILFNSGQFDNLDYIDGCLAIQQFLEQNNLGKAQTKYRLRDWGISRQRYWGCPIPIIHCELCGDVPVPENQLPVILPLDIIPDGTGSPLARMPEFYNVTCPKCNNLAKRETDTMDTFVDSSWYYARYSSYDCKDKILDERANYWCPVDQYVGGIEHAILHLLYARFIHKCLRDLGLVHSDEPFKNLLTQGMVLAETFYRQDESSKKTWFNLSDINVILDGKGNIISAIHKGDNLSVVAGGMEKMSKSKNNGIDPQALIKSHGADTMRLFVMFAAPPELSLEWSEHGIEGSNRFIRRIWRFVFDHVERGITTKFIEGDLSSEQKILRTQLHQTINKVTNDIDIRKQFNTAIANIMELLNSYSKFSFVEENSHQFAQELLETVIILLSPIIPHVCEELWQQLSPKTELLDQPWPISDLQALEVDEIEMVIQINGKLRGKILIAKTLSKSEIEILALANPNVQKFIIGQSIKKIIVVPNKLINIVV